MQKKKLLGSALALALVSSYSQVNAAEMMRNLKVGAQIDVQATSAKNITDFDNSTNDRIADAQTRLMANLGWELFEGVTAMASLVKNNRVWGTGAETLDDVTAAITIEQAYIKVGKMIGDAVDVTLGRQYYGQSGDIVAYFGPSDKAQYGLPVTALDAARFDWSGEHLGLTAVFGEQSRPGAIGVLAPTDDLDLRGLILSCKKTGIGAYVYNSVLHTNNPPGVAPQNSYLWVAGVKGKVDLGMLWVAGEIAKNFGEDRTGGVAANFVGWAAKADVGAKLDLGAVGLQPWLHAAIGSGDNAAGNKNHAFQSISSDYRPGAINGRFATPVSSDGLGTGIVAAGFGTNDLSDRAIAGFGVKAVPSGMNKFSAGLSYWHLNTQKGVAGVGNHRHLGSEVDLDLGWQHNENISLNAGVGRFFPGSVITRQAGGSWNNANLAYLDMKVKWGADR